MMLFFEFEIKLLKSLFLNRQNAKNEIQKGQIVSNQSLLFLAASLASFSSIAFNFFSSNSFISALSVVMNGSGINLRVNVENT